MTRYIRSRINSDSRHADEAECPAVSKRATLHRRFVPRRLSHARRRLRAHPPCRAALSGHPPCAAALFAPLLLSCVCMARASTNVDRLQGNHIRAFQSRPLPRDARPRREAVQGGQPLCEARSRACADAASLAAVREASALSGPT